MAAPTRTRQASGNKAGLNRFARYYWIANKKPSTIGGTDGFSAFSYTGKASKGIGLLCTVATADAIPFMAVEEIEFLYGGKEPAKSSFGKKIDPFNLNVAANDYATLFAMIGRDQGSATINSWEPNVMYDPTGHLLVNSYDYKTGALLGQALYMDMQVSFTEFPGLDADGERFQVVTLQSPDARIVRTSVAHNEMINVEFWRDNAGTDVNATAPDGIITAFVLGTGNGSYSSATTPVALQLDSTNSSLIGWGTHLIELTLNGALVPKSGTGSATFATSTITFAAAPADATSLMAIYVCNPSLFGQACFSADPNTQTVTDTEYPWYRYGV